MGRIAETLKRALAIMQCVAEEPKPISRIAEELGLRWNTVRLYIEELEELGLVEVRKERSAPPVTTVELTFKGEALLKCLQELSK